MWLEWSDLGREEAEGMERWRVMKDLVGHCQDFGFDST